MTQTFNEFQRELQKRNIEPNVAYILTMMYEQFSELMKQHLAIAAAMAEFAQAMAGEVKHNEKTALELRSLKKIVEGRGDISVASVANDPDTEH